MLTDGLLRGISTVNDKFTARDELGLVGGEVDDGPTNIIRLPYVTEGMQRIDLFTDFIDSTFVGREILDHVYRNEARVDRVDSDLVSSVNQCIIFCHQPQRSF